MQFSKPNRPGLQRDVSSVWEPRAGYCEFLTVVTQDSRTLFQEHKLRSCTSTSYELNLSPTSPRQLSITACGVIPRMFCRPSTMPVRATARVVVPPGRYRYGLAVPKRTTVGHPSAAAA